MQHHHCQGIQLAVFLQCLSGSSHFRFVFHQMKRVIRIRYFADFAFIAH